ncbi:SMEK domain-containing protein [Flavobacterium sp. FlaQc-30]|uniref:SMEK domain-containing protein n=1 Tax=Flavobacterium sp. FlaQc-30 TaxID=3374179 RepID=UPI003756EF05
MGRVTRNYAIFESAKVYFIMSVSTIFLENIKNQLLLYAQQLESSNKTGNSGPSVLGEGLFLRIFNIIFGWELINANRLISNQSAFDLVDQSRNIYVQVTANGSYRKKFNDSVSAMKTFGINAESDFIVFFITSNVTKGLLKTFKEGKLSYRAADLSWLIHEMQHSCDAQKLKEINSLLQDELGSITISQQEGSQDKPCQELVEANTGFIIRREALLQKLFDFSTQGNSLVAGGPGYGKSFMIDALQREYNKNEIPCFVIRINELIDGDDVEVSGLLGVKNSWLEKLAIVQDTAGEIKPLLIFDALDTAKDERLKARIYQHLRNAMKKLSGGWNVLVCCRAYDASKSLILQELFPAVLFGNEAKNRYMEIPQLDEKELHDIFFTYPEIRNAAENCTADLRRLLLVPYFLGLFQQIVSNQHGDALRLTGITAEWQLLGYFWKVRVESSRSCDFFAHKLTSSLAAVPSLVAKTYNVLTLEHAHDFEELSRQHIITEHRNLVSFTHNILLEYAVNRYLMHEQLDEQIRFIRENEKLPFLFRQSFIYFYSELWDSSPDLFWEHYFGIRSVDEPVFRLFHQTILNFIIIVSFKCPADLQPVLEEIDNESRAESLRKVLESLRFVHKGYVRSFDLDLLSVICRELHPLLLWETGVHLETAIDYFSDNTENTENEKLLKLGEACRIYMQYVLKERPLFHNRSFIDQNSGYRGVKNLCKTFYSDPEQNKEIIIEILSLLEEEDFPLNYFSTLSECITDVFKCDPEFGAKVYKTIYLHNEVSDKPTSLGGAVLALNSNRKQDFEGNYYGLEQNYKQLLEINFYCAAALGAAIVNKISVARSFEPHSFKSEIVIGHAKGFITDDYSSFDEDENYGPYTHAKLIFEVLQESISHLEKELVLEKLYELVPVMEAGCLWQKMLDFLKNNVSLFSDFAYKLLLNKIFFETDETIYGAAALLGQVWPYLSREERGNIEAMLFKLENSRAYYPDPLWQVRRIRVILSEVPYASLVLEETMEFIRAHGIAENNLEHSKGITAAEVQSLTAEELRSYSGFYEQEDYGEYYSLFSQVESFNSLFKKHPENPDERICFKVPFKAASQLFNVSLKGLFINERMKFSCDRELARFGSIISAEDGLCEEEKRLIKEMSFHYISIEDYKVQVYENGDLGSRFGGAFSPSARTSSVQPLLNMMYEDRDAESEKTVLNLMSDNSAYIRLTSLSSLPYFWRYHRSLFWDKIFERLEFESDGLCITRLIKELCYDNIIKDDLAEVAKASRLIASRLAGEDKESLGEIWKNFAVLLITRVLRHDREQALNLIKDNLHNREFCRNLTFQIRSCINSINGGENFIERLEKASVLFDVLQEILRNRFTNAGDSALTDSGLYEDLKIIDHVIMNIYFAVSHGLIKKALTLSEKETQALFNKFLPLLYYTVEESSKIENGFMAAHTGYYFMQTLNLFVRYEPVHSLKLAVSVVVYAAKNGFTYDSSTLREVVKLAERLMTDHKKILSDPENFNRLITILDQFAQSGSQEALELTWSLKEVF